MDEEQKRASKLVIYLSATSVRDVHTVYPCMVLLCSGVTLPDLKDAGYSPGDLQDASTARHGLRNCSVSN